MPIFKFCNLNFQFNLPYFALNQKDCMGEFVFPDKECNIDGTISIKTVSKLSSDKLDMIPVNGEARNSDSESSYIYGCNSDGSYFFKSTISKGKVDVEILETSENYFLNQISLLKVIGIESMLLYYKGLMLHSSLIDWNGAGILFSGPSGIGKSTQAKNWELRYQAETLDGDRSGLIPENGVYKAYGLPYAGTSGIFRNKGVPVKAIVILVKGTKNQIKQLGIHDSFLQLFPEINLNRGDHYLTEKAVSNLMELLHSVPVFRFECLPDCSAAEFLQNYLKDQL